MRTEPFLEKKSFLWAAYLYDEVKSERERATSFEQRGVGVLSLSGVLIALLLNVSRDMPLSRWSGVSEILLLISLASLVLSAMLGLLCAMPLLYGGLEEKRILAVISDNWLDPDFVASTQIAAVHFSVIKRSRRLNSRKARFLWSAIATVALGILLASGCLILNVVGKAPV
ncbi:hypothetical protein AB0M36_17740 [Actinoplanes sp. NPDC051346]|uniref:hypothetical protein n=1 Tax=Actinoplanes sp. NPDC051346 TaxID=3155048 RepID=UPI003420061F